MRVLLNIAKRDNFSFFDPVNKVHINRVNPMCEVSILSPSLRRAILAGNIIDVDNSFDLEISDKIKTLNEKVLKILNIKRKAKEEKINEPLVKEEVVETAATEDVSKEEVVVEEEAVEKPVPKKRTRKVVK